MNVSQTDGKTVFVFVVSLLTVCPLLKSSAMFVYAELLFDLERLSEISRLNVAEWNLFLVVAFCSTAVMFGNILNSCWLRFFTKQKTESKFRKGVKEFAQMIVYFYEICQYFGLSGWSLIATYEPQTQIMSERGKTTWEVWKPQQHKRGATAASCHGDGWPGSKGIEREWDGMLDRAWCHGNAPAVSCPTLPAHNTQNPLRETQSDTQLTSYKKQ